LTFEGLRQLAARQEAAFGEVGKAIEALGGRFDELLGESLGRFRRRLRWMKKAYARGWIGGAEVRPRLRSWIGHARQANSTRLLARLCRAWVFQRGRVRPEPGSP
jgi:RNA-directed DNA polymerase